METFYQSADKHRFNNRYDAEHPYEYHWKEFETTSPGDYKLEYTGQSLVVINNNAVIPAKFDYSRLEELKSDYGKSVVNVITETASDYRIFHIEVEFVSTYFMTARYRFELNIALSKNAVDYNDCPMDLEIVKTKKVVPVGDLLRVAMHKPLGRFDNYYRIAFEQLLRVTNPGKITVHFRVVLKNLSETDMRGEGVTLDLVPVISWSKTLLKFVGLKSDNSPIEPSEPCVKCGKLNDGPIQFI